MSTNYYDAENNKLIPIAGIGKFPADYGTKAEFETKKDSLPVGTVFTTTDEFEDFLDDESVSDKKTWSSKKINDSLVDKADYKLVVESGSRYVEDVVTQEINNWLPNDNSSILINLKKSSGEKYVNFQLICNKTDSKNWECLVNGTNILWKISYVNGVRTIKELATTDEVPSSKNRISEQIVTMDTLDGTKTGMSIDFDANSGQIRLYVMKNGVSQKMVVFKSV